MLDVQCNISPCVAPNVHTALEFASKELCNDEEVVLAACASACSAAQFASARARTSPAVVLASKAAMDRYVSEAMNADQPSVLTDVDFESNQSCEDGD
jgi:hypothetical protein